MRNIKNDTAGQEIAIQSKRPHRLLLGKRGTVALIVALTAPLLAMAIALGVEVSGWSVAQQRLQRTADMAALAAVETYNNGSTAQVSATEAAYVAEINGAVGVTSPATRTWTSATSTLADNMITVAKVSGVKLSTDVAFKVTVNEPVPLFFSAIALAGKTVTLSATAIAEISPGTTGNGPFCILALDSGAATGASTAGVDLSNGASVTLNSCGLAINATGAEALDMAGGGNLVASSLSVGGQVAMSNGATMSISGTTSTNVTTPVASPYSSVPIPSPGTCSSTNTFISGQNIPAGTYCGGLNVSYGTVTMGPGLVIINGGNFTPAGGSTVNAAAGTTIVLTGTGSGTSNTTGTAQIANGTTINITAPTSGTYAGIAIIQDPLVGSTTATNLAGGTSLNITGALLFPKSIVDFSNGSSSTSTCTQLVAYQIVFTGGARLGNNCSGIGTSTIGAASTASQVSLVE